MRIYFITGAISMTFLLGCGESKDFDGLALPSTLSGSIIVSSVATDPATGPGLVSWWSPAGAFKATLRDLFSGSEFATGLGFIYPDKLISSIDGVDRLEVTNLSNYSITPITNVGLTANTLKQLAIDPVDNGIYVAESSANTVEKFTINGQRIGAPFLNTTTSSCVLSNPWGIAVIPDTQEVIVISSAASGRFSKFTKDGSCVTHSTAAPFNSGTPQAIAYHPPTGKLIVTFATSHAIIAVDQNGANPTTIFQNSAIINTPRAIAIDADGYIYVGSSGTDTIEKLYWSGSGSAVRATTGPLIGPGVFSQNPTAITVIP